MSDSIIKYLEALRTMELELVSDWIEAARSTRGDILAVDMGGGSGFQAGELAGRGIRTLAFDPAPRRPMRYPVMKAYGHSLPLSDGCADVVLSSQVLEHVPERYLADTLAEVRRILKPSGVAVFTMPSVASMAITILLQPLANLLRFVLFPLRRARAGAQYENPIDNQLDYAPESFKIKLLKALTIRWFLPPPHGVGKTALHELLLWRVARWEKLFWESGFDVAEVRPLKVAYSMHLLTGLKLLPLKKTLGALGLGGTNAFLLKKRV